MSHSLYDSQWHNAMDKLAHLSEIEIIKNETKTLNLPRREAYDRFCMLYIRYLQILGDLEEAYDQIVHPQKRRDIKLSLDIVIVRMLQLKRRAIQFSFYPGSCWNYLSFDEYASNLQLSLNGNKSSLDLIVPKYFLEEELVEEERLELVEDIFSKSKAVKVPTLTQTQKLINLSLAQCIAIICKIERARQSIQRAKVLKKLKCDEKRHSMDENTAAITIQRVFKGHNVRSKLQQNALNEMLFLGMSLPNKVKNQNTENEILKFADLSLPKFCTNPRLRQNAIREKRVNLRIENEVEFERNICDIRDAVILEQGPKIRENARQQRFEWAIKQREEKGAYPTKFDLFYQKEKEKDGDVVDEKEKKSKKDKKTTKEKKGKKEKKEKKGKKEKKKKKAKKEDDHFEDANIDILSPQLVENEMSAQIKSVYKKWRGLDEKENFAQKHSIEMVKESLMPSVKKQIEFEVDEQLLAALDNLRTQLGLKKNAKKGKGKKKKGKKSKKSKKKKTA